MRYKSRGQMFAIQRDKEKTIIQACPDADHESGIYFIYREDYDGKHIYIGKAVDLLRRLASHLMNYQRIDLSLRKRGLYSVDNTLGWQIKVLHYPENELDKKESYFIQKYQDAGYDLYNIESGGTQGKTLIAERKEKKGYLHGVEQGRKAMAREIKHIIDTHCELALKKETKVSLKAFEKLENLFKEGENNGSMD